VYFFFYLAREKDNMDLNWQNQGQTLLNIFKTWYASDKNAYSEYYLVLCLMMQHLYPGSIDEAQQEANRKQMEKEINTIKGRTHLWTIAVYGPFLAAKALVPKTNKTWKEYSTQKNADLSLNNAYTNRRKKDATSIAYLTHGAQYTLWYGMKSNQLRPTEQKQFGLPEGTTHAQAYEQLLCTVPLLPLTSEVPTNFPSSNKTNTKLEKVDMYIEVLLTCRQMRQKADRAVLQKWYMGIIDMKTMRNKTLWEDCKTKTACKILKQRCHIKMILWFLLARLAKEDAPPAANTPPANTPPANTPANPIIIPPTSAPSAPISVQKQALTYLQQLCAVTEFVCLPKVGVQQLDVLDTLLKAAEAEPLDPTAFLTAATTYVERDDDNVWTFTYHGIRMEIAEGEKQHLLYRFAQAKNTNKVIYALVPLFARIFRVYDDKEACQKRCGYTEQCEFNNDASVKLFNQFNYGKGTQTLEQVLQRCQSKDRITGFNCNDGMCRPSTDSNPRFSKADYGNLATAHQQCLKYCEGTAGYTCYGETGNKRECTEVQEDAAFPFKNYESREAAREACNKESENCLDQQSPFDFEEITNITGKECGQETKGVGQYENFYFPWPQANSNRITSSNVDEGKIYQLSKPQDFLQTYFDRNLAALKGFIMNHGAGSGKTITAQAIVSNFLDSNHNDGRDAWHVLWVTKSSLKEQPLQDFYLHPSGFLKRAILRPTPFDMQRWMRRMSNKNDPWKYKDKDGNVVTISRNSRQYLPLDNSGQYDIRKDTNAKQLIRFRICMHAYYDSEHRKRFAKNFNLLGKDVERISAQNPAPRVNKAITYQAFVDLLKRKRNKEIDTIRDKMWQMGGNEDPLRKTLVVVDEAHNLVSNSDHYHTVLKYFHNSFQRSKDNSCKVVLMTATPITTHPVQAVHLLHLIQEDRTRWLGEKQVKMRQNKRIPVPHYTKENFVEAGPMTWERKMQFSRLMGNDKISYFAGELDPRFFALKLWGDISQVDDGISFFGPDNGILLTTLSTRMIKSMRESVQSVNEATDIQRMLLNRNMTLHQARGNERNHQPDKVSIDEIGLVKDSNAAAVAAVEQEGPPPVPSVKTTAWMRALLTRFNDVVLPEDDDDDDY
jgi:hypothetical protein